MKKMMLLSIVVLSLLVGCIGGDTQTEEPTPMPTAMASPTPTSEPTATPTPSPTPTLEPTNPNRYTNIAFFDVNCYGYNMVLKLENQGPYVLDPIMVRISELDGDEPTKTCLEFEFVSIAKRQIREMFLFNAEYGVEECDYQDGRYRVEPIVEENTGATIFTPKDFDCKPF